MIMNRFTGGPNSVESGSRSVNVVEIDKQHRKLVDFITT
jgi:hypothetical protein